MGLILTVWRVLRCNPWNPGGYDPVPETGLRYKGSRIIPPPDEHCCACEAHDTCRGDDGKGHWQDADDGDTASYKEDGE